MPSDPRRRLFAAGLLMATPAVQLACEERPAPTSAPRLRATYVHSVFVLEHGQAIPAPTTEPALEDR